jgi:hypothetical protein
VKSGIEPSRRRATWAVLAALLFNLLAPVGLLAGGLPFSVSDTTICRNGSAPQQPEDGAPANPSDNGVHCPLCILLGGQTLAPPIQPLLIEGRPARQDGLLPPASSTLLSGTHWAPAQARAPPYSA